MKYRVCEYCGNYLDFGEVCDCQKNEAATSANVTTSGEKLTFNSLPQNPDYVKAALDLAAILRATHVKYKDIAETVKETFPKFNRQLLTACANWEDYGVLLHPDGIASICDAYDLPKAKKRDNRKLDRRITFRVTSANFARIERNMEKTGANTLQEFVAAAVAAYNERIEND
jgi:hypothetical protein